MNSWSRIAAELVDVIAGDGTLLLLTDYDGTLTPIVRNPETAWLSPDVRDDFQALVESARVHVAVVSGRRLDDLRLRVRIPGITLAGCHGLEIEGPGLTFRHPEAAAKRGKLRALAGALELQTASMRGVRVEVKGLSCAVHYRGADPAALAGLQVLLDAVIRPRVDVRVLRGRRVIEILPTAAWDKGHAALWIREQVLARGAQRLTTTYFGDDMTDEPAFRALDRRAITVRVGCEPSSHALCCVGEVADVHRIVSALAAEVRGLGRRPIPDRRLAF